jgi:hypothetical protein
MQDWKQVQGSQEAKPEEFDLTTSATVAYQRRNIKRVEVEDMDGSKHEVWQYEEREMSHDEAVKLQLAQDALRIGEIDETSTTGLLAVTDLYEELINKGVL